MTAAPVTAAFAPSDIAGLAAWYDLSDSATLWKDTGRTSAVTADADVIKGVTDKSGNAVHLSEATNGPTYKTAIQNSRAVARFDGSVSRLNSTTPAAIAQPYTVVGVAKDRDGIGGTQTWLGGTTFLPVIGWNSTGTYRFYAGTAQIGGSRDGSFHVFTVIFNGASSSYRIDQAAVISLNPGAGSFTYPFTIGMENGGSGQADVDIGELLIYNSALSGTNLSSLEAFLKSKWGTA